MTEEKKALVKKVLEIGGAVLLVGYLLVALFNFSTTARIGVSTGIDVVVKDSADLQFVQKEDVRQCLMDEKMWPQGDALENINTTKIERMLKKKIPAIKEVACYKTPDGVIRIDIYQRVPVLRVFSNARSFYVDEDGQIMEAIPFRPVYVPLATGYVTERFAKGKLFDFTKTIKDDDFWNSQIEQIDVERNGDVSLTPRVGDQTILLGTLDSVDYKLEKLKTLYEKGFNNLGWNKYKEINLKYDKQVICTK